jgi:hypothetical protein
LGKILEIAFWRFVALGVGVLMYLEWIAPLYDMGSRLANQSADPAVNSTLKKRILSVNKGNYQNKQYN